MGYAMATTSATITAGRSCSTNPALAAAVRDCFVPMTKACLVKSLTRLARYCCSTGCSACALLH